MTTDILFWLMLFGLFLASVAATAAQALHHFGVHELEEYCRRRQNRQAFGKIVDLRERLALGAESLRIVSAVIAVSTAVLWYLSKQPSLPMPLLEWLKLIAVVSAVMLVGNGWIPIAASQLAAVPLIFHTWRIWWLVSAITWPMQYGSRLLSAVFQRASGNSENAGSEEDWLEDEIRSIMSEGERDGLLESGEADMIEGVMQLDEKDVCSVMTPRSKLDALEISSDWDSAVRFVVASGRTRIPVYEDKIDNIVGILFAKDLLRESLLPLENRTPLRRLVRQPMIVPESKMLDEMLRQFLTQHSHLAVIVDEYGGVAGIVTIEDILEEIVGEIEDESDDAKPSVITMIDHHNLHAEGGAHIAVINKALGVELPDEDDFDTIAGLIMSRMKEIPRTGAELKLDNVKLRVQKATRRTIDRVEVQVVGEQSNGRPFEADVTVADS